MNIIVCMKQVPNTNEVRINQETGTLIRDGVPSIINPDDKNALEEALKIRDIHGGKVKVISMGPMQAKNALKEALAMGADEAYLISDRVFGGSDTWATAMILKNAIEYVAKDGGVDIVFCGRQAIDGDTAQVGPEIGEQLGLPQVTYALEAKVEGDELHVRKEIEGGVEVVGIKFPCLVTFTKPSFDPRYPTIKSKLKANKTEIPVIAPADLPEVDLTKCGLKGSPTRVKSTFVPPAKQGGVKIKEETDEDSAKKLFTMLSEAHVI